MEEVKPRFEFRVWAANLDDSRKRLEGSAAGGKPQESTETYVLSSATSATNVKIRAALLDIKELVRVKDGLEQWRPTLKESFPVAASIVRDKILAGLRVDSPILARGSYSFEDFMRDIVWQHPNLKAIELTKFRTQYKLDVCSAEFTEVRIHDSKRQSVQTVAVESEDGAAVRALVAKLGLEAAPNLNYVRELKRLAGIGG